MRFLTTAEAERIYGIPADTFAAWCREGKLKGVHKRAKAWRIPDVAIENYLDSNPALRPSPTPPLQSAVPLDVPPDPVNQHRWQWVERVRAWRQYSPLASLLTTIGAILVAVAAVVGPISDWDEKIWPPTPTPLAFSTAVPDETLILVAQFHVTTGGNSEPHVQIRRRIEEELAQLGERNVRVEIEPTVLTSDDREKAEALGQLYQASMVIWGEETGVQVVVNYLNLRQPYFDASEAKLITTEAKIVESQRVQVAVAANPEPYIQFITQDLPGQMSFLALFALAQSYYFDGNYPRVIEILERPVTPFFTNLEPQGWAAAYFLLGRVYHQLSSINDLERAVQNYSKSIEADPNYALPYNNRGSIYGLQGDLARAFQDFSKAIEANPKYAPPYNNRGGVYFAQGDFDRAIQDFNQAIELAPNAVSTYYYNRGYIYYVQGDFGRAIQDFDQAIELDPNDAFTYNSRGGAYYAQGNLARAIQDFDQAIELDPSFASAYNNRGSVYYLQGNLEDAIQDFDQAIELDPNAVSTYNNRGTALLEHGDLERAIQDFDQAIELGASQSQTFLLRSIAHALLSDFAAASADLQVVVDMLTAENNPSNTVKLEQAQAWLAQLEVGINPFTPEILAALRVG